jgi:predicted pyridoxine 5'-phosphate oxidase superfamily flavin-nucleotide-binding protein
LGDSANSRGAGNRLSHNTSIPEAIIMSELTSAMQNAIEKAPLFPLATASKSGIPNVIPVKFVFIENAGELWLVDNFFNKTRHNLLENPQAALYVYSKEDDICIQLKGTIEIQTSGANYQRMRDKVHAVRPDLPAKALAVMRITEIFQCLPGANPGGCIG